MLASRQNLRWPGLGVSLLLTLQLYKESICACLAKRNLVRTNPTGRLRASRTVSAVHAALAGPAGPRNGVRRSRRRVGHAVISGQHARSAQHRTTATRCFISGRCTADQGPHPRRRQSWLRRPRPQPARRMGAAPAGNFLGLRQSQSRVRQSALHRGGQRWARTGAR